MSDEDVDVIEQDMSPPAKVNKTRQINGKYYLAGEGPKPSSVMFVSPSVLEEEASDEIKLRYGKVMKQKPQFLRGPAGSIFKDLSAKCGLPMSECFYTALCRWLLPRDSRLRPKKPDIEHGLPALIQEIKEVRPHIIVCLGKTVFDLLVPNIRGTVSDLAGAWFYSNEYMAHVYLMDDITKLVTKPEFIERFRVDLLAVRKMLQYVRGERLPSIPVHYRVIRNKAELRDLVALLRAHTHKVRSIDCEWHGRNHKDGQLRSLQICWEAGQAAFIRFMDDKLNYVFDCSYEEAGAILGEDFDDPEVKFIGHHLAADLPWLHEVLKLQWYDKGLFDTEFAQQCVDEYEPLGLERMALRDTDMGRYDLELFLWYKDPKNKAEAEGGYGRIPDHIMIPYGCGDVDVVMRAWPRIRARMDAQPGLSAYYDKILNPFVTNFFTSYALQGLPMNITRMDELRDLFHWARREMSIEFQKMITVEAEQALLRKLSKLGTDGIIAWQSIIDALTAQQPELALEVLKNTVGASKLLEYQPFYDHLLVAPDFNIRSPDQMRRWLYTIKGYIPIKSTNNKDKGLPATDWEKVLSYDASRQKEFKPSTDKQSLEILSTQHKDPLLIQLLQLNAVGNLCKAFLKEATVDVNGETLRENGLHYWLSSDGRIHGQMSTTETGRPRSWQPNSLNWPGWVNDKIGMGIANIIALRNFQNALPDRFVKYIDGAIPSIRACVESPPGWCIVESDYQTAELRGQAFLGACEDMINLITRPDPNFAKVKPELEIDDLCVARLGYPDYIPESKRDTKWFMTYGVDGKIKKAFEPEDLLRDSEGNIVHAKQDLHWSLAEMVHKCPREDLHKKKDRNAAKVGNFSSAYGASENTLERKIESDTGIKPEEGTGKAILDALEARQPRATAFLKSMEEIPTNPGYYRALSGRIRHFYTHPESVSGLSSRTRDGQISAMGRECRNFP